MKIKEIQDNLTKEFGQYELKKQIGEGGNAPVFRIRNKKNGKEFALKYPSFGKNDNEKKKRFKNEIQIVKKIAGSIPGVIPILDVSKNFSFYTMPIATEIDSFLVGKSFDEIIKGTIQLAETLEKLHKKAFLIGI